MIGGYGHGHFAQVVRIELKGGFCRPFGPFASYHVGGILFDVGYILGFRQEKRLGIINSPTIRIGAVRCLVGPHRPIDVVILVVTDCFIPRLRVALAIKFPDKTRDIPISVIVYVFNNAIGLVELLFRAFLIRVQLVDDIGPAGRLWIRIRWIRKHI